MRHLFTFFIVAVIFCGCHSEENKYTGEISIFPLEENSDPELLSAVIDSISFLPLIEQDDFVFANINKLIMKGKYIYIMDMRVSNSLLVFDNTTGAFVRKIGTRGNGGEEYNYLRDFDVDFEHIYLYDRRRRILKYDLQGNFIEAKGTPFHVEAFKILKNRKYLFALDEESKYQIVRTDSDFNVETSFFPFPFEYEENRSSIHRDNILQTVDGVIFYNVLLSDTVYSFSEEGDFTGGVLFDFGQKTLPERLRKDAGAYMSETGKYNNFVDAPFKVNQLWIGIMANEVNLKTFAYDNISGKYYFYRMDRDYTHVNRPMFANSKYVVGWMDIGVYNRYRNKPPLDSSAMAVLEDGGHVLSFYHLKQNGK
jgi:hypothetical protein